MPTIVSPPPPPPIADFPPDSDAPRSPRSPRSVIVAGVAAVATAMIVMLPFAALYLVRVVDRTEASVSIGGEVDEAASTVLNDALAQRYFGTMELAAGSSIELRIDGAPNARAVEILEVPSGIEAWIDDAIEGQRLSIDVPSSHPGGVETIMFEIAGEAEPVAWQFTVLSR